MKNLGSLKNISQWLILTLFSLMGWLQPTYAQNQARVQSAAASGDENWDDRFSLPYYIDDFVTSIVVTDSGICAGGNLYGPPGYGPTSGQNLVIWNGKEWMSLCREITGNIYELGTIDDDLYVGGYFKEVDGMPAKNIARWNLRKKNWSGFGSVEGNGFPGGVHALAVSGKKLYVGGYFTTAGGKPANNIAVWNSDTQTWAELGKGIGGFVYTIAINGKDLYVGGEFSSAGGIPANNIARWDGKKWFILGKGLNGSVKAITFLDGEVYVGGRFTKAGEDTANYIAKWNPQKNRWSALDKGSNGIPYGNVTALKAKGKVIYVGATFIGKKPLRFNRLALYNPATNTWSDLGSGVGGSVFSITTQGNDVYIGGEFLTVGGKRSNRFAVWHEPMASPVLSSLPELRFNEDRILFHRLHHWYPFVADADDADSTLKFTVLAGKQVKTTRHPRGYSFTAPANWFGRDTLQVIVTDPGQLADTTALVITVDPVNDKPQWTGLPDSLSFHQGASVQLKMWDWVEDIETPDSLLLYRFAASKPGLRWNFHRATGTLVLTAPQFHGNARFFVKAGDGKAAAHDTILVRVAMPNETLGAVAKQNSSEPLPTAFELQQNYPNPFNPTTLIRFGLPREAEVKLEVLNLNGQLVATLLHERKAAGFHEVLFEGAHLPSGNYFAVLRAGETKLVQRMVLMK